MWRCKHCGGEMLAYGNIIYCEIDKSGDISSETLKNIENNIDDICYYCNDCGCEAYSVKDLDDIAEWIEEG